MKLFENWANTKAGLLEGLSTQHKKIVGALMENQKQVYETLSASGGTGASAVADFQKIAIPMIRRVIPGTIATELVGVQPLAGPVGLVYSMRYKYGDAVDAAGTANDITAGDEAFANGSKVKRFFSSADVGTTGFPPALTATTSAGNSALTADYEAFGGRAMSLQTLKQTITAGSRKLRAEWTQESEHDLKTQHGMDMQSELATALSSQIAADIDNEILTKCLSLAGSASTYDFTAITGYNNNFIGDKYAMLGVMINKMANDIGMKIRMGQGNWMVTSGTVISALQSAARSVFAPAVQGNFDSPSGNRFVGTLNSSMKVYSYNWGLNDAWTIGTGADTAYGANGEDILIGYKGQSENQCGLVYAPYVPIVSTGTLINPNSFTMNMSLSTRYGIATFQNTATSLGNSPDYFARINVRNLAFS